MKLSFQLLLGALCVLPIDLTAQIVQTSHRFSLLRCSDLEIIDADNSYGLKSSADNIRPNVRYISPTGDFYVVKIADQYPLNEASYQYYKTETGQLLKEDLNTKSKGFVPTSEGLLAYSGDIEVLDMQTLGQRWSQRSFKDTPFYVHNGVLLAFGRGATERLYGYSLATGEKLWKVKISHEGGVSDVFPMDDDHVLIVADDLVKLNIRTGESKKFEINNYVLNGKMFAGHILAGVALGIATGMATGGAGTLHYVPVAQRNTPQSTPLCRMYGDPYSISYLSSNIVTDGNLYYLADRDCVRCFDSNLEVKWTAPYRDCHGTTSRLHLVGNTLRLVNFGIANYHGGDRTNSGTPFIASYDAKTGECLSFEPVGKKHAKVKMVRSCDDGAGFLFEDSCKVIRYGAPNQVGMTYSENLYKDYTFPYQDVYVFDQESRQFIPKLCNMFLLDKDKNLSKLESGNIEMVHPRGAVYATEGLFADSLWVVKGGPNYSDCWLIREDGTPVYHVMEPVDYVEVTQDNLFLFSKSNFTVVNKDMLKPAELSDANLN